LLIDADCHRPMVHRIFGLPNTVGLTDVLQGKAKIEDVVGSCMRGDEPLPGLSIIPAGTTLDNPSELLASSALRRFFEDIRSSYDWILVDTPPVLFVSDATVISGLCDACILVVKSGNSTRSMVSRVAEQLASVEVNLLGAILNAMHTTFVGSSYSSYYKHGYSRYYKDYHQSYRTEESDSNSGGAQ